MIIKGAIIIAKSHIAPAVVSKIAAYAATHTITTTLTTAGTIAGAVGVVATVAAIPQNAVSGFKKLVDGIEEGNVASIAEGLNNLRKVYSSVDDLFDDFSNFVDNSSNDIDSKRIIKEAGDELRNVLKDELYSKSIDILKEACPNKKRKQIIDDIFKETTVVCNDISLKLFKNKVSLDEYYSYIQLIYRNNFDLPHESYQEYLNTAGVVYNKICVYNSALGIKDNYFEFDHYLIYCIAGWILNNTSFKSLSRIGQTRLANDITNNILQFLDDNFLISDHFSSSSTYNENIELLYNHYFFNVMQTENDLYSQTGKLYRDMYHYNQLMGLYSDSTKFDYPMIYLIAGWVLKHRNYTFLKNVDQAKLASDMTNYILRYIRGN